jgi:hypothetical protein
MAARLPWWGGALVVVGCWLAALAGGWVAELLGGRVG